MTTQTQTPAQELAAKPGKHPTWPWGIVNAAVIVVGIVCGYSLESHHHASAAVMQPVAGFARGNGLHQAMQNLCIAAEPKPDQQAHAKRVTLL